MNIRKLRWLTSAFIKRHRGVAFLTIIAVVGLAFGIRYTTNQSLVVNALNLVTEKKYVEGMVGTVSTLNPILVTTDPEQDLSRVMFRGLTKNKLDGSVDPDLAQSWEVSSTGQVWLFHLKKDQFFQNGGRVTANDVAFTYDKAKTETGSRYRETFKNLDIQVLDDETILFRLPESFAPFISLADLGILPKQAVERQQSHGVDFNKLNLAGMGTTQFNLRSVQDSLVVFTKGDTSFSFKFYQTQDDLTTALKMGEINSAGFTSQVDFSQWKNLQTQSSPLYRRFIGIFYNTRSGSTSDKNVRQALSYATDKTSLIKNVLGGAGEPAFSSIPPVSWAKSDNLKHYDFDQSQAKSLLDKAGWTGGPVRRKDNSELAISISYRDTPEYQGVAAAISKQWAQIGIRVLLNPLASDDFNNQVIARKDFQAAIYTQEVGLDPDQYVLWHTSNVDTTNVTGLKLPKLDKALEDGRHLISESDRKAKYTDFQRFLIDEAPVTFLYYPRFTFVTSNKIQGIDLSQLGIPADRFSNLDQWNISRTLF